MTTIAYKDGVLAGDRRLMNNGWIMPGEITKVFKERGTYGSKLIGFTGCPSEVRQVVAHLLNEGVPPESFDLQESRVVVISRFNDIVKVYEGASSFEFRHCGFFAFGSGSPAAHGAMAAGASARDAVLAASKFDPNTGDAVDVVSFHGPVVDTVHFGK